MSFIFLFFHPFLCYTVNDKVLAFSDSHNSTNNAVVVNLVNQPVTSVLQLDLVNLPPLQVFGPTLSLHVPS